MPPQPERAALARAHMVDSQVRPNRVSDARLLQALRTLPRERFAPPALAAFAYADTDLDLGGGRFMLAPLTIARLLQLVLDGAPQSALVIGAGAGYGAALLSLCGVAVTALEPEGRLDTGALAAFAPDVHGARGPLDAGWPGSGPFDAILIEGAASALPEHLAPQLVPKGRLVCILEGRGVDHAVVAERNGEQLSPRVAFDCAAPLLAAFSAAPAFVF